MWVVSINVISIALLCLQPFPSSVVDANTFKPSISIGLSADKMNPSSLFCTLEPTVKWTTSGAFAKIDVGYEVRIRCDHY